MTEQQMERFEGMLTQLVTMVGHIREDMNNIKEDMSNMKEEMNNLKEDMKNMKEEIVGIKITQERQHQEVLEKIDALKVDQDLAWAKIAQNERDIMRIKQRINL
ncbi:chromosome segregation ATPase [Evansella vedderi]|uniref:Chromosome segregation ATPase n=1 Tax=Evansella vedderi TaxID=38282 RepID=A0ABU0A5Y5_9BACI|nr:hypothetical protein [Evansella vedderi]MDQ0257755.1 chromosome segregation ATPase [Evansella vedderi]